LDAKIKEQEAKQREVDRQVQEKLAEVERQKKAAAELEK